MFSINGNTVAIFGGMNRYRNRPGTNLPISGLTLVTSIAVRLYFAPNSNGFPKRI